jgi:hypothetical protein
VHGVALAAMDPMCMGLLHRQWIRYAWGCSSGNGSDVHGAALAAMDPMCMGLLLGQKIPCALFCLTLKDSHGGCSSGKDFHGVALAAMDTLWGFSSDKVSHEQYTFLCMGQLQRQGILFGSILTAINFSSGA